MTSNRAQDAGVAAAAERPASPPNGQRTVSAVLPAYNEAENLPGLLRDLARVLPAVAGDYEIIVVDDGSTDATPQVVSRAQQADTHVRHVRHAANQGYGAALASGFQAAVHDLIFLTDGDHQFDVSEIRLLLRELEAGADFAIGYRARRQDHLLRRLNGWGWNLLVRLLFGYTARDVDCAFKLFPRSAVAQGLPRSRGAAFSAEFLVRARRRGYRISEVPVTHLPRRAGRATGARPSVILRAFREILRVWWELRRDPAAVPRPG
ncbi:MAG TPA: glycosyltransferase family 2 protein [Dehalococcoidia bacterium]